MYPHMPTYQNFSKTLLYDYTLNYRFFFSFGRIHNSVLLTYTKLAHNLFNVRQRIRQSFHSQHIRCLS